ncbi:nucleoside triphosphate pyrophosphohydrolase, partial [Angustibacter aerolatus]
MPGGSLQLLLTSARVAPGLLSRAAWQALERADDVLCRDVDDEQPAAVASSAVPVQALDLDPGALSRELLRRADAGTVVWVGSPDGDPGLTDALANELSRRAVTAAVPEVEVLVGSHDVPGARLLDVVAVMDRLRSPGGCPWDAEQTHDSLVPYLLEEAHEAAEAIETMAEHGGAGREHVREELGDVLLQVVFHARVAAEHPTEPFDVDDVAAGLVEKLVRRHPHVFAEPGSDASDHDGTGTADGVQARWDELKAVEQQRDSVLDGVPVALPALARADKLLGRIERAGLATAGSGDLLADELLALVRRARDEGRDAEGVLRAGLRAVEAASRAEEAA